MNSIFTEKTIMVPVDFTLVTDKALSYATSLAKIFNSELLLLHVADKNTHHEAEKKLAAKAVDNHKSANVKTDYLVVDGNIFDQIGRTAADKNAALVVMGTHGIKGSQKFLGSHAMKVITHSKVPYIVTQHKPFEPIKNILIPVDFSMEIKQVLVFSEAIAKQFDATIHLLPKAVGDESLERKVELNIRYSREFFEEENINVKVIDNHLDKDFVKDIVKTATFTDSSLIVIIIDPETGLTDYIAGSYEQKVIANEAGIPVMCINMKTVRFLTYDVPVKG